MGPEFGSTDDVVLSIRTDFVVNKLTFVLIVNGLVVSGEKRWSGCSQFPFIWVIHVLFNSTSELSVVGFTVMYRILNNSRS